MHLRHKYLEIAQSYGEPEIAVDTDGDPGGLELKFRNGGSRHDLASATASNPKAAHFHPVDYCKRGVTHDDREPAFSDYRRCLRHEALRAAGTRAGVGRTMVSSGTFLTTV